MYLNLAFVLLMLAGAVMLSPVSSCADTESAAQNLHGKNPHTDNGDCSLCHVAPEDKLRGWFVFPATKQQLVTDPNTVCRKCHGVSFGHGIGKKPLMNRYGLPLDAAGTINCALTCHEMHVKGTEDINQQRYHLRLPHSKLCVSCHDK